MDRKPGASFFCSYDIEDRSSLRKTLPALAFRRVREIPGFRVGSLESIHLLQPVGHESSVRDYDIYLIHGWL